jgi:hypothetical protein
MGATSCSYNFSGKTAKQAYDDKAYNWAGMDDKIDVGTASNGLVKAGCFNTRGNQPADSVPNNIPTQSHYCNCSVKNVNGVWSSWGLSETLGVQDKDNFFGCTDTCGFSCGGSVRFRNDWGPRSAW